MTSSIKIGFAGDFCLVGSENRNPAALTRLFQSISRLTNNVDLSMANFEFSLTRRNHPVGSMSLPAHYCDQLKQTGFDIFFLANNHLNDYGEQTLCFTISHLQNLGFKTVGAGSNINISLAPLRHTIHDKTIDVINVTDATHQKASKDRAGVAPLKRKQLIDIVSKSKKTSDLTVVSIHADIEFTNLPAPWKLDLSRSLAEAGADIIVHHHPHTLQGIEVYKGSLIAYSLGNFVFPVHEKEYIKNRPGGVAEGVFLTAEIRFTDNELKEIGYSLTPTIIDNNNQLQIPEGAERQKILESIDSYSMPLNNKAYLAKEYHRRCVHEMKATLMQCYYTYRKKGFKAMLGYIKLHLSTQMHRNWIRGFFTFGYK